MSDFQITKTVSAKKVRRCPECGETIAIGQRYAKETGSWEGDFYTAFMCLPCKVFTDRYVESMRLNASLNWDEVSYSFGDIINEAAEYAEYKRPPRQPRPEMRAAIMALFGEIDLAERTWRQRERREARKAKALEIYIQRNRAASFRMLRGMALHSAIPVSTIRHPASGIEARRAETHSGSVYESPSPQGDARPLSNPPHP